MWVLSYIPFNSLIKPPYKLGIVVNSATTTNATTTTTLLLSPHYYLDIIKFHYNFLACTVPFGVKPASFKVIFQGSTLGGKALRSSNS